MINKWVIPFAVFLGTTGVVQAATVQDPATEKQLLMQEAEKSAAAIIMADPKAATSYLEVAVDETGNFTCGMPGGAIMLFGHPDPWSSATTIRVDGVDHWNYSKNTFGTVITPPSDVDAVTNESVWDIDGKVKVTENLKIIKGDSGNDDTLQIAYTALNQDTVAHDVGVRVMLDTMLGDNDGAPFRIPEVGEVTMETEFTGANVPLYWEAFESLTNGDSAKARGTLLNSEDMPTRIVFADWTRINDTPWDFTIDPTNLVTGDSAVGVYWEPVSVQPGQSITRTTFYGLSGMAVNGNVALSMPGALTVENGSYMPNPFPVTAYVSNSGTLAMTGVTATLTLPAGLTLESGNLTQTIGTVAVGDSQQISWSVVATGTTTGMLTVSAVLQGTNLPAKTVSETITVPALNVATTTALNATPNQATFGQNVTLNATVTAANGTVPTGSITFSVDGNQVSSTALAAGAASYVASGLTVGAHTASANYAGDVGFNPSGAQTIVSIVPPPASDTSTAITVTPNPVVAGQPVTITAKVTATNGTTPTGNVTFSLDGTVVSTQALVGGSASYTTPSNLTAGSHTVIVNYAGVTDSFNASNSQITFVVQQVTNNLPVAITNAATLITASSAKLNGNVTPNGSATTVSFDFGYNTAYGLSIAATPANLAATTVATAISGTVIDLDECTEYHYRVQATNSAGTVYGADKMFKTTGAHCSDPDAWLYKPNPIVLVGKPFTLDIHINTHGGSVGAFDFDVGFDNTKMMVDTAQFTSANNCYDSENPDTGQITGSGVCPGSGALGSTLVTTDNVSGNIKIVAFDAMGSVSGNDLQVVQIHFIARSLVGVFPVSLTTNDLSDPLGDSFVGNGASRGSNVAISAGICGDADGNSQVNIIDALSIARKVAGLPPPPTINTMLGDVDRNGTGTNTAPVNPGSAVKIVDALHIARHSVALQVGAVNACAIGQPLPPGD
jgi:hypothetical protein